MDSRNRSIHRSYSHSSSRHSGGSRPPSSSGYNSDMDPSLGRSLSKRPSLTSPFDSTTPTAANPDDLAASSDGLQAILRDHPELVTTSLAAAAQAAYGASGLPSPSGSVHGDRESRGWPGSGTATPSVLTGAQTPEHLGAAGAKPDYSEAKIVVAMVGLPARGKSYLSNKLMRYLKWLEYDVKVFNVGQLRRALAQRKLQRDGVKEDHSASFFDPNNPAAATLRSQMAVECLEQLIAWLRRGGNVGIHDATNSSKKRRAMIEERIRREPGLRLIFIESICSDPAIVAANIAVKVRSGDPDYKDISPEQAKADFLKRIKHYEDHYEALGRDERHLTYCKIEDVGHTVVMNRVEGYLQSRIAFYLMNLHLTPRNIFISRHGESQFNVEGKIGGDSGLSERGWAYANALPDLIKENIGDKDLTVWTSTLRRTQQTASRLPYDKLSWKALDELDAGVCDGMTYEEIARYFPEDYAARDDDKFNYRYRGGESYRDVVIRLEPIIMELERQENILIIGHQAILRCLYAYFHNLSQEELPYIKVPLHTVIRLTPKAYGCDEKRYTLPIGAVDTFRPRQAPKVEIERQPSPPASPVAPIHSSGFQGEAQTQFLPSPPSGLNLPPPPSLTAPSEEAKEESGRDEGFSGKKGGRAGSASWLPNWNTMADNVAVEDKEKGTRGDEAA